MSLPSDCNGCQNPTHCQSDDLPRVDSNGLAMDLMTYLSSPSKCSSRRQPSAALPLSALASEEAGLGQGLAGAAPWQMEWAAVPWAASSSISACSQDSSEMAG